MRTHLTLALAALLLAACTRITKAPDRPDTTTTQKAPAAYPVPEPHPVHSPLLVGCYYFPGHFNAMRWVPMVKYGHPYPLLGYYRDGEPVVSDWHVKWAVEHGIDFFAFDWYYDHTTGHVNVHNKALDQGFLRARYRGLMKFCIFWCNEARNEPAYTEAQMLRLAGTLRDRYFTQPNYLKLDGRAVLMVSMPHKLIASFGVEGCAALWRKMSAEAGVPIFPVAKQHTDQARLKAAGFAACTAYNYPSVNVPKGSRTAPYDTMATGFESIWKRVTAEAALPYIVPLSPGWDSRPWHGANALVRTHPRPDKFRRLCEAAKRYVNPKLNAVIVECWNEFGEGSYIEPCTQYGFGYLDAIRDAFCPDNPHHLDLTPQQLGQHPPVYHEIPVFTDADVAAQDGNMIYNPGFEKNWGWAYYHGDPVEMDTAAARSGRRSAVVPQAAGGLKSHRWATAKVGDRLEIWAWVRTERGASASVKCALFAGTERWLGRYLEIGHAHGTRWQRVAKTVTWSDAKATCLNIEIVPHGGTVWVDDVGIRRLPSP